MLGSTSQIEFSISFYDIIGSEAWNSEALVNSRVHTVTYTQEFRRTYDCFSSLERGTGSQITVVFSPALEMTSVEKERLV